MEKEEFEVDARSSDVWTEKMEGAPEFGSETLSQEQIEDIYHGTEVYGADKIDFCADKEKMKRLMARMGEWGNVSIFRGKIIGEGAQKMTLSPEELIQKRSEIVRDMAGCVEDVYGIRQRPEIEISGELGLVDGGYQHGDNKVLIDETELRVASSADSMLRFLAHELTHCYDETEVARNGSVIGAMIKYNSEHYVSDVVEGYDGYEGQLNERRAFAREKEVMRQFEEWRGGTIHKPI